MSSSCLSTSDIYSTMAFRIEMCSQHFSHLNLLNPLLAMHDKDVNVSPILTAKIQVPSKHSSHKTVCV